MKTSRNKKRIIITIVVAALAIVAAILIFDNQQKKAASEESTSTVTVSEESTATVTASEESTATIDEEEPGSLYYEETVRFNNVDLIKKDIPEWLIDAIEKDDPVVVARTIAERVTRANLEDFGVRTIYGKDPIGFYCWNDGYIKKEGDKILIGDEVYVYLDEPTVPLIIPEEKKFGFVETLINLLWKRDRKCFWTAGYEHFIEIKEAPFPSEQVKENCIFIDGEFISIMPDTATPEPEENPHKYADRYFTRSVVWYSDETETFYTIKSYDSMIKEWKWSPTASHHWEGTGKVPTLPEDSVISTGWQGTHCWYVVKGEEEEVTVYEPYEFPESKGEFGIRPVFRLKFEGVGIARPFVIHEGNEGGWETAYVATPETNTLWKINGRGVYKKEMTALEVTEEKVIAQNYDTIEVIANRLDGSIYGTWVGYYTASDYDFQEIVSFEEKLDKIKTSRKWKTNERGEIVIETDDVEITLF